MKENAPQSKEILTKEALSGILREAHRVCLIIGKEGGEVVERGAGFGELGKDTEIAADKKLAKYFLKAFEAHLSNIPFAIHIEGVESGEIMLRNSNAREQAEYFITVDPLDGSLNYKLKGETLGLPYSAIVAIFDKPNPTFSDCLMAGCVDLRTGDIWLAERGNGCFINGKRCATSKKTSVDIKNGIIIGEFYYPENRELLTNIFAGQKGWLRNSGSAAYEMSLVASGQVDAFICDRQKSHELGAAYLMITEAGGYVCDLDGQDLSSMAYQFNSQVPVIASATKVLAQEIVKRIQVNKSDS